MVVRHFTQFSSSYDIGFIWPGYSRPLSGRTIMAVLFRICTETKRSLFVQTNYYETNSNQCCFKSTLAMTLWCSSWRAGSLRMPPTVTDKMLLWWVYACILVSRCLHESRICEVKYKLTFTYMLNMVVMQGHFHVLWERECIYIYSYIYIYFVNDSYITFDRNRAVSHLAHYCNVIVVAMASQITSFANVYSIVYSGADQRKHQSSTLLVFVRGIHRWQVDSTHKGPVTQKMFPFDDVIMVVGCILSSCCSCAECLISLPCSVD